MIPLWALALALFILLVGGLGGWWAMRRTTPDRSADPVPRVSGMGYGTERWVREVALWQGTLRRLEIQARQYESPPPHLQQQILEARNRIAEAEQKLHP